MPREKLVTLGTSATTTNPDDVQQFRVPTYAFKSGQRPAIGCQGLTASETVTLLIGDGSGYQVLYDVNGAQAIIDAAGTRRYIAVATPGIYGVLHSALAAERDLVLQY